MSSIEYKSYTKKSKYDEEYFVCGCCHFLKLTYFSYISIPDIVLVYKATSSVDL